MVKKMTKNKESLTLEVDKAIVDALGINEQTDLDMIVVGNMLIIKPKNKLQKEIKNTDITNRIMDEYDSVLKKLAKT